ncbi:hypothetical protein Taro_005554, partial [Colocasia esculenta]|nr:hypothetical protein [Colocasia esculenta]
VVMRNQRSQMGQGKSDEHPPYEELIIILEEGVLEEIQVEVLPLVDLGLDHLSTGSNSFAKHRSLGFRLAVFCAHLSTADWASVDRWLFPELGVFCLFTSVDRNLGVCRQVVMGNQRSQMGQGKSDEHPPYEELIV